MYKDSIIPVYMRKSLQDPFHASLFGQMAGID